MHVTEYLLDNLKSFFKALVCKGHSANSFRSVASLEGSEFGKLAGLGDVLGQHTNREGLPARRQ